MMSGVVGHACAVPGRSWAAHAILASTGDARATHGLLHWGQRDFSRSQRLMQASPKMWPHLSVAGRWPPCSDISSCTRQSTDSSTLSTIQVIRGVKHGDAQRSRTQHGTA